MCVFSWQILALKASLQTEEVKCQVGKEIKIKIFLSVGLILPSEPPMFASFSLHYFLCSLFEL